MRELAVRICCLNLPSVQMQIIVTELLVSFLQLTLIQKLDRFWSVLITWQKFGARIPKEKCVRFFEPWCSEMDIDTGGKTQTDGNIFWVFVQEVSTKTFLFKKYLVLHVVYTWHSWKLGLLLKKYRSLDLMQNYKLIWNTVN